MHHAILGPGGIGGLMGATLAHIGERVTMVVRESALPSFPEVIHLESKLGTFDERVAKAAVVPASEVLWITVKATQLDEALLSVRESTAVGAVVPLLNGIDHLAMLSRQFGENKLVPATIAVESERVAPGRYLQPSPFVRLNLAERGRQWLGPVIARLEGLGVTSRYFDHDATLMWSKIAVLAPLALSTTAANTSIGGVIHDTTRREQVEACVRESVAVAKAEGAEVDAESIIASIHRMPHGMRSSMQKDLEQGNPLELDAIAGPILRAAARHSMAVPVTQALAIAVARRAGVSVPAA